MGPKTLPQLSFRGPFLGLIVGPALGSEKSVKKGEQKPTSISLLLQSYEKVNVAGMPI